MKLKQLPSWINSMNSQAYIILRMGLMLSCLLLALSAILLMTSKGSLLDNYNQFLLAKELFSLPVSVLLISILGSACLEDINKNASK